MFRTFLKTKKRVESPEKLFFFLDKIINICLIKIERGEIKSARNILSDLDLFLHKFFSLKQKNPGRFLSLVSPQEIYDNACPIKMPGHFYEERSFDAQCADNLKVQTLLHAQIQTGKEIKGFGRLIFSFEKIWESALRYDQPEISSAIFQILDKFLKTLLEKPFNDLFVEVVLKIYHTIFEKLLKTPENSVHEYAYRHCLLWYQKYVLNRESLKNPFDTLEYEELLDNALYKMLISLINHSNREAFTVFLNLVSEKTDTVSQAEHSLSDVFHLLEKGSKSQYDYFKNHQFFTDRIDSMQANLPFLDNFPKRNQWLKQKEELFSLIKPHLEVSQLAHFQDLEADIVHHLLYQFRKQKTIEIMVAIIAYSLLRNKLFVPKEIFSFYLPYDVSHTWFTDFILPASLTELMLSVNKKDSIVAKYTISEGFRVPEVLYNKAFLILLSSFVVKEENSGIDFSKPRNVKELTLSGSLLNSIRCDLSSLLTLAHDFSREDNSLDYLGIKDEVFASHWKNKMIPFLSFLVSTVDKEVLDLKSMQQVSEVKKKDFIEAILGNYYKNAVLRKLFADSKRLIQRDETEGFLNRERVGLNVVDDKAQFLENWENSCSLQILDYGIKLALSEDKYVFSEIRKKCRKVMWEHIADKVDMGNEPKLMLVTDLSYQNVILKMPEFSPLWTDSPEPENFTSLWGEFTLQEQKMPIVVLPNIKDEEGILILERAHLGYWEQFSPLNEGDDVSLLHDFLYINLQAFSEKQSLLEEYLKNPPVWLAELGSEEKQRAYLQEHILIHILERFQWTTLNDAFTGYSVADSL